MLLAGARLNHITQTRVTHSLTRDMSPIFVVLIAVVTAIVLLNMRTKRA
jgi:hypothetical protein